MQTTWVLAADSARARIFEWSASDGHLHEIDDLLNPDGRAMEREIDTEPRDPLTRPGGKHAGANSTYQPASTATQHAAELFSKDVARCLDQARNEHKFDKLCVVAEPHMLGLLRNNLSKEVQKMVEEEIAKDISNMKEHDMEEYLRKRPH
jgi:protein required for attachment to host cells